MINLPNVTAIAVSGIGHKAEGNLAALQKSCEGIEFYEAKYIQNSKIKSLDDYSRFMLFDLLPHIETSHALTVQYDGYVINPEKWDDAWLEYDYIGAPWPPDTHFTKSGKEVRVGNGGFTLRSHKLIRTFSVLFPPFTDNGTGFFNEDGNICVYHRDFLESFGIKFAPVDVAAKFSRELIVPETVQDTFGFHRYL